MNILIPMTGDNKFSSPDIFYPKPLVEISSRPMIELAIQQFIHLKKIKFISIISKSDALEFSLSLTIEQICSELDSSVIEIEGDTSGSLCTCLLSLSHVNDGDEILIINYDQYLHFDIDEALRFFRADEVDFGVICFNSTHPKWSYVQLDNSDNVLQAAEKKPISKNAMAGVYYFKNKASFFEPAQKAILEAPLNKSIFFISDILNHCILSGQTGKAFKISSDQYTKFSSPTDIDSFLDKKLDLSN